MKASLIVVFGYLAIPGQALLDAASFTGFGNRDPLLHTADFSLIGFGTILSAVIAIAALIAAIDRSARKHLLQLESAEERERALFDRDSAATFRATLEGDLLDVNEACARLLGHYSRSRAMEAGLTENLVNLDEYVAMFAELDSDGTVSTSELEFRRPDGSTAWLLCHASIVQSAAGGEAVVQGTLMDITERKQLEVISAQRDVAESASKAKSEFLSRVTHEIRTPMNGILGMADLVLDTAIDPLQREYLNSIKTSAKSLLAIINDALDFSKIEANRIELDPIEFNLQLELRDAVKALAVSAHEKNLELICDIDRSFPDVVIADPTRFRQILLNLLANAVKFTKEGSVLLRAASVNRNTAADLHFQIIDTGIGIPPEKRSLIFEPFSQADRSITREFGGTGLGLTISSRLAEQMGGRIWVETEIGRGSNFHFAVTVPISRAAAPGLCALNSALRLAGKTVLVIEDHPETGRVLERMLRDWEMKPVVARSESEALSAAEEAGRLNRGLDLLLVDAQMPKTDSFELAHHLRCSLKADTPVVMMIGSADRLQNLSRCRSLGIEAFVMKPVWKMDLENAVVKVLESGDTVRATPPEPDRPLREGQTLTILLAEDNLVNQKVAARLLEKQGHRVTVANNGIEALTAMFRESFDVVLMDVQMPEMSGLEATRFFREHEKTCSRHQLIVAMTAYALPGDREKCLEAGMDDYISKPFLVNDLCARLGHILASRVVPA